VISWRIQIDMLLPPELHDDSLYQVSLEQAAWADKRGLSALWLSEHHGSLFISSPLVLAGALAAVTERARIIIGCLLLPLHDPIRVAEDHIMASLISRGRTEVIAGIGYAPHEFEMFGISVADRGRLADKKLPIYIGAMAGEPFDFDGRRGHVLPGPYKGQRPPVLGGGAVPASARRAARYCDGFAPADGDQSLADTYRQECLRLGRKPGPVHGPCMPLFVHVTNDPEKAWSVLGASYLHEVNYYGKWAAQSAGAKISYAATPEPLTDVNLVRSNPAFAVVTPEQCIALANKLPDGGYICQRVNKPGIHTDMSWESLELFATKVLPHIPLCKPEDIATPVVDRIPWAGRG
jgi:alkanesulfonate monooxygenase SsuD/methylene tetrahydromethanopterin reductase-like flavin-dependent oxidoreductase (luciferase family)